MKSRLAAVLLPLAAGVALLAAAGPAAADTVMLSGTVTDDTCGPLHALTVATPTRIAASVAPDDLTSALYVHVLNSSGVAQTVTSHGRASVVTDVYAPGVYVVEVCRNQQYDGATVTYSGTVRTSAAPATPVVVAGAEATLRRVATGSGTVRTRSGLATFSFRASNTGPGSVTFDAKGLHLRDTNILETHFSYNRVTLHTANGATVTFLDRGARGDLVTVTLGKFRAAGTVVRGGLRVR